MHFVHELWAPILLAAVGVFVVSSVLHMLIPIHRNDYRKLPDEDAILAYMRDAGIAPGEYVFPCPDSMKDMGNVMKATLSRLEGKTVDGKLVSEKVRAKLQ